MSDIKYQPISPPVKAVFLDFGDTLVETEPLYVERLRMSFERLGVKRTFDEMEMAYLEADWRSAAALLERDPFPQDAWRGLYAAVMAETLKIEHNVRDLMKGVSKQMALIKPVRKVIAGVMEFLEFCKERGIEPVLLSNNDGRTREKSREVGIEGYFKFIFDSTVEGMIKPNPAFFKMALEKTRLKPSEALHVGDLLGCDVLGAQKAGIKAAWFHQRRYVPHAVGVKPDYTVHSFEDIEALLGK